MLDSLYSAIQKAALPGVWSKGVALSRENAVIQDSRSPDGSEITLRVRIGHKPVSPKVNLWPEDEDWYCDCGDRNDPCIHIIAAVVALKNGTLASTSSYQKPNTEADAETHTENKSRPQSQLPELHYCFVRKENLLALERWIVRGENREPLTQSLIRFTGGISSGRIAAPSVPATQDDFTIDQILYDQSPGTPLPRATLARLLPSLRSCPHLFYEGKAIRISPQKLGLRVRLTTESGGFRLSFTSSAANHSDSESFQNGAVIRQTEEGLTLFLIDPVQDLGLTPQQREWIMGSTPSEKGKTGRLFSLAEIPRLTAEILPPLQSHMEVDFNGVQLPQVTKTDPRIILKTESLGEEILVVTASLVYGHPPIAEVTFSSQRGAESGLTYLSRTEVPLRDLAAEQKLIQRLHNELHLRPGQPTRFISKEAIDFTRRARDWNFSGTAAKKFAVISSLIPKVETNGSSFQVLFQTQDLDNVGKTESSSHFQAKVFQAWRENLDYVPLLGGGYAALPTDWLNRYGERILALASHQQAKIDQKLPQHFLPELVQICEETGGDYPESLKKLRETLENHAGIPQASLPKDLQAQLRPYQAQGINWLCFLKKSGMGALLADDMGLGKTLQTIAAIEGKTLIITPTSVLQSWAEQISKFRPSLQYSIYYGSERSDSILNSALKRETSVILTSYGILRLDQEKLSSRNWDMVILDEAQTIKNPQSQIAQAAHRLRGSFKIALSGTPIENRLEDLWSQFQFINPGLLGNADQFKSDFIEPISRGDASASQRLKKKIRPFLLRRLKKEVAQDLPPRTETVLHCELSSSERDLYDAILASTRKEVIAKLETGGSVFAALEALLRLRQACCHPLLVPGGSHAQAPNTNSSKLDLLLESLEESISLGHRALIFSQWTSLLDLVENTLKSRITYSRIDGSTKNRAEVIADFQRPNGPQVMLLSLKAGGVGITLTAADHIYILDPWWNPAVEDQAADRAHRIGQENPVLIHRLVAKDTVEDRILALQKRKQELAATVLGDSTQALSLTREDLIDLLKGDV